MENGEGDMEVVEEASQQLTPFEELCIALEDWRLQVQKGEDDKIKEAAKNLIHSINEAARCEELDLIDLLGVYPRQLLQEDGLIEYEEYEKIKMKYDKLVKIVHKRNPNKLQKAVHFESFLLHASRLPRDVIKFLCGPGVDLKGVAQDIVNRAFSYGRMHSLFHCPTDSKLKVLNCLIKYHDLNVNQRFGEKGEECLFAELVRRPGEGTRALLCIAGSSRFQIPLDYPGGIFELVTTHCSQHVLHELSTKVQFNNVVLDITGNSFQSKVLEKGMHLKDMLLVDQFSLIVRKTGQHQYTLLEQIVHFSGNPNRYQRSLKALPEATKESLLQPKSPLGEHIFTGLLARDAAYALKAITSEVVRPESEVWKALDVMQKKETHFPEIAQWAKATILALELLHRNEFLKIKNKMEEWILPDVSQTIAGVASARGRFFIILSKLPNEMKHVLLDLHLCRTTGVTQCIEIKASDLLISMVYTRLQAHYLLSTDIPKFIIN